MNPDRGGGVVIMPRTRYITDMYEMLNVENYELVSRNAFNIAHMKIQLFITDWLLEGTINKDMAEFFKVKYPILPVIFGIPKIHKNINYPHRPIISAGGSFTEPLAIYIDKI